ncbi:MAG: papain-like cysteine protease family protein [Patescibacteria group bacterium]|nr:papain-like cysteine protease family protein [Patescibacteria group bacterium]
MFWRRALSIIVPVTLMLVFSDQCQAQTRPPDVDIDVPLIHQETDEWCWLATVEMVLYHHMGYSPYQCELLEERDGHPDGSCCDSPYSCSRCAEDLYEIQEILTDQGVASRFTMALLPNALYSHLEAGHPVIAQVRNDGVTHAVVIRGMRYVRDHSREHGWRPILIINDPWRHDPVEMTHAELAVGWLNSIIVTE